MDRHPPTVNATFPRPIASRCVNQNSSPIPRSHPSHPLSIQMGGLKPRPSAPALPVGPGRSFTDLMRVLTEEYKHEVGIQYHDFAGELLTIASERSLDAAKAQHEQRSAFAPLSRAS